MFKELSKYLDLSFFGRFLLLFVPLYYFHILYLAVTDPKNFYSSFLDTYLNYIKWVTSSINNTAKLIDHLFGIEAIVDGKLIFVNNGASVLLEFTCLGLGIISFWIAFVVAHKVAWKKKLFWCVTGVLAIWFLNCWRIAILLMALQNKWKGSTYFDHHDVFNFISYIIIGSFIYMFYKKSKKDEIAYSSATLSPT